jgi:succinate dehydrogenase hydrophobic anchor subunit
MSSNLVISFVVSFFVRFTAGLLVFFSLRYLFLGDDSLIFETQYFQLLSIQSEKERLLEYFGLLEIIIYVSLLHASFGIYHVFEEYLDCKNSSKLPIFRLLTCFSFLFLCFLITVFF